ncbi:MAG: hypothetical protein OXE94_15530 [Aestuariivita sp.]|nr:hypothetical protein [Aestuariivita sp.]MCY4201384.1 hypothetical protein [Aestuariivita sp.]
MKHLLFAGMFITVAVSAVAEGVTVDNCGETAIFEQAPERLVIRDMNMTDMAFALELQDRIVGCTGITVGTKLALILTNCGVIFQN